MNKEGNSKVMLLNCNSNVMKLENKDIKIYDMTNPLKEAEVTENDIVFLIYDNTKELQNGFDFSKFKNKTLTIGFIIHDQDKINQDEIEKVTRLLDCYVMVSKENINNISNIIDAMGSAIFTNGLINFDLTDVKDILKNAGKVGIDTVTSTKDRLDAANRIIENMEEILSGSTKMIIHILSDNNLKMSEVDDIVNVIRDKSAEDVSVIYGSSITNKEEIYTKVTVIAVV